MPWNEPSMPAIEAVCDQCKSIDFIEVVNLPSGHWIYPQPGERGSMGWDYGSNGDLLCPDCMAHQAAVEKED